MAKRNIDKAKEAKKDEFYTQLDDINNELKHYREHFRGKTVLCNCDDPRVSNFFTYFAYNFEFLGLKKLITTCVGSALGALPHFCGRFPRACPRTVLTCLHVHGSPL